jgi:HlyD family secretion protein
MQSTNSTIAGAAGGRSLAKRMTMMAGFGAVGLAGFGVSLIVTPGNAVQTKLPLPTAVAASAAPAPAAAQPAWLAAAPGRIEPRSGLIRIGAALPGRVSAMSARINDKVAEGEVLMRLDDKEARARLVAAEAEAAVRKRERDSQPATTGREELRKVEDSVFEAERAVTNARFDLDEAILVDRRAQASPRVLADARRRFSDANDRLRQERAAFAAVQAKGNIPQPNRLEAGLIAARTDVTLAEMMLDRARIRAPIAGTVLQINAKVGEMVAPAPEQPLAVIGDMSTVRARAEVDESDVSKIKLGQSVFVRSNAFPGRDFEGKVAELAPSLALPRMGSRGARRATDVEVMEVVIELDAAGPLLPGMRADVFFRR